MNRTDKEMLLRLGAGASIESICAESGITMEFFRTWWQDQITARVPATDGSRNVSIQDKVELLRDRWGVPHIFAKTDHDLYFGYGYVMAQDRLWQLDYYRRKAMGRLSEILGSDGLENDIVVRTVGINRIARQEVAKIAPNALTRLEAFSHGINALMAETRDRLPIEFDLLGYEPEPWSPLDSVAIWGEFRWYLTGRLPVIAIPEFAKRTLGEGPLYEAFITGEAPDESIIPKGSYAKAPSGIERVGDVVGDPEDGIGSNNWVVSADRSTTGAPMVASDPHIAFGAVSCWYEAHLQGPDLNVAGVGYVGMPAIIIGRNDHIAWGITNNICSQRDLYLEKIDPAHPGHFFYDGRWEPARTITEEINIKGSETITKTIICSRNGPIADELLPTPLQHTGPVSLRWLGAGFSDELSCLMDLNTAPDAEGIRKALKPWVVPTWSFVFADRKGNIGYQCVGRIPIRNGWNRGYRPGWDPDHQWQGFVPYGGMPALFNPPQGYARSANNRTAPEDFPYPLSGTWNSGYRARRIRDMIEEKDKLSREDFARMQMDVLSMRAVESLPGLLAVLSKSTDSRMKTAHEYLKSWDCRMETDRVGASIFEIFFSYWIKTIAAERFPAQAAALVAEASYAIGTRLLDGDGIGWFKNRSRDQAVLESMSQALDHLEERLGTDMSTWSWGKIHSIHLNHLLSHHTDLKELLQRGGCPVHGNGITVCNTGFDPNYLAAMGANWRHNADLSEDPPGLWAVDAAGQSGHPGSPHYCDQLSEWLAGRHRYIPLDRKRAETAAESRLILTSTGK